MKMAVMLLYTYVCITNLTLLQIIKCLSLSCLILVLNSTYILLEYFKGLTLWLSCDLTGTPLLISIFKLCESLFQVCLTYTERSSTFTLWANLKMFSWIVNYAYIYLWIWEWLVLILILTFVIFNALHCIYVFPFIWSFIIWFLNAFFLVNWEHL